MKSNTNLIDPITYMILAGGRIRAFRCQALSKQTKLQCGVPAIKAKRVCRKHGGKSTGPTTNDGKQKCAEVKTIHGWETREKRSVRAEKFKEMDVLVSSLKSD